jgi:hypothetical protein
LWAKDLNPISSIDWRYILLIGSETRLHQRL